MLTEKNCHRRTIIFCHDPRNKPLCGRVFVFDASLVERTGDSNKFAAVVVPHLAAAYSLARWLLGNGNDAEDVVQEAALRAFRSLDATLSTWFRPTSTP